jgi:hypothetical protein
MSMRGRSTRHTGEVRATYGARDKVAGVLGLINSADAEESKSKQEQEQEQEQEASALSGARNLEGNGGCGEEHVDTGGKSRGAEKSKAHGELG